MTPERGTVVTKRNSASLCANTVSFSYQSNVVLRDVTVAAASGQCVGILGPNGAGKTTLLHLLAGLLNPMRGTVQLGGDCLDQLPRAAVARRLALVPQETTLAFDYSVLEIALMGRHPHLSAFGVETPDDIRIVTRSLASTGTEHLVDRLFSTLSGGEKQRVVIASALAQLIPTRGDEATAEGTVLLLDEPTASLDLGYQLGMMSLLRALHQRSMVTMVVSTHDLNFAVGICDQLVLLRAGEVIAAGPTEVVLTADNVRSLYGVETDVSRHEATGRLLVVPHDRKMSGVVP